MGRGSRKGEGSVGEGGGVHGGGGTVWYGRRGHQGGGGQGRVTVSRLGKEGHKRQGDRSGTAGGARVQSGANLSRDMLFCGYLRGLGNGGLTTGGGDSLGLNWRDNDSGDIHSGAVWD